MGWSGGELTDRHQDLHDDSRGHEAVQNDAPALPIGLLRIFDKLEVIVVLPLVWYEDSLKVAQNASARQRLEGR